MAEDKTRILTPEDVARIAALAEGGDDKTRILSSDEVAGLDLPAVGPRGPAEAEPSHREAVAHGGDRARPAPRLVGDKIVFHCANGHRIAVDRALAGKRGNCSKQGCGVPVVIPIPPGFTVDARPAVAAQGPHVTGVAPPPAAPPPASPGGAENFVFDRAMEAGTSPERDADAAVTWPVVGTSPPAGPESVPNLGIGTEPAAADAWGGFDAEEIDHPTARLVARLWLERAHGGIVEVHLSGGSVIMPEWYDPRWSCGSHAMFAALAADQTLTLTAVAWDQVQKIVVRRVHNTPEGMFES